MSKKQNLEDKDKALHIAVVSEMLPKEVTATEVFNYFYYLGAADGIAKSLSGGKPDFDKRFTEFMAEVRKGNFR
ncbi:MAG: hypothetical protein GY749_30935 [Desulfobacteraceae bacterium]|nr:hypothetical protein [Desulfobacteraceae bacterium]